MFLAVARFELNGCFRTLICRYSGDQGMGEFAPEPTFVKVHGCLRGLGRNGFVTR
jgi:hypothetical protein